MNKFNYYKRVVNGEIIELHLHENREDSVIAKVYPIKEDYGHIHEKEMVELMDLDTWLDVGLSTGIFDSKPIPQEA